MKGSLSLTLSLQVRSPWLRGAAWGCFVSCEERVGIWVRGEQSVRQFAAAAIASPAPVGFWRAILGALFDSGLFLCTEEGTLSALPCVKGDWCTMEAAVVPPEPPG